MSTTLDEAEGGKFPSASIWLFAHDLLGRHVKKDFITTTQTVVSRYSAELSHRQDGTRCRPDDSCRPHARNPHHSQQGSTQSPDLNTFS